MTRRPRQRMSVRARLALFLVAMGLGVSIGLAWWTWRGLQPRGGGGTREFTVEKGQTPREIARQLQRAGLIRSAAVFLWGLRRWGLDDELKYGTYALAPQMSPRTIAETIARGDVLTYSVTVPEGWTIQQIAARLGEMGICDAAEFRRLARYGGFEQSLGLERPASGWEGYLFPETYQIPAGATAGDIAGRMLKQFLNEIEPLRADIRRRGLSLHEVVTLASMIEREAKLAQERATIASVYYNRLARGMKLECDATVVYAWARQGVQKRRLTFADLRIDSPYNTYRHAGLPVGPIGSPGLPSLEAAVRPAETGYLYYVARGDGSHAFTRTQEEHEAAVRAVRGR